MAQDIVGSLFGMNPNAIYGQQMDTEMNQAVNFANMNPVQQANYGGFLAGQMLGRGVSGLMGAEDPRLQQARVVQEAQQQGYDVTTPEGLQQLAQFFVQKGQPGLASQVAQQMQGMQKSDLEMQQTKMGIEAKQQGIKNLAGLQEALRSMPPDMDRKTFINTILPFMDNVGDAIKLASSKYGFDQGEVASEEAGPVGKGGAYKDTMGVVRSAGEMKSVNEKFNAAQLLLNEFNKLKEDDITNAYSPVGVDWTTKGELTRNMLSGKGTLAAQAKIAKLRMEEVIKSLPPGAASDKDIAQALASFPGFGDEAALIEWVNNAKQQLQDILDKHTLDFGTRYTSKYKSSGPLGQQKQQQQQAPTTSTGEWRLK